MNVIKTTIPDLLILEPRVFKDARGYFFESFSQRIFDEMVRPVTFVQENESRSSRGVVRGLHFQKPPYTQAKLVRCTRGRVLDVVVDIRKGSATFGKSFSAVLSEENHLQLFIPKGFAHGFSVLSDVAVFQYQCDEYYHPEAESGISALDPALAIDWLIPEEEMIMSEKDRARSCLTPDDAI
ncbi:MAG: dTDP-4-dehydrorhamnose 3,5-epimerase [Bacteroidales bacterium]|nr:dTDP-4-dehydrorhamnose 3,5-epimerase [Bacteroidales bacterium]